MKDFGICSDGFQHSEMATIARSFAGGNLPLGVTRRTGPLTISMPLRQLSQTFVIAQEYRHLADYDTGETFARNPVMQFIDRIESAINGWPAVREEVASKAFLFGQLVWNRIRDR